MNITKSELINDPWCFDVVYKEDSFILRYDGRKWVTYYCEKGSISFKKYYDSESDALLGLLEFLRLMKQRREIWKS